MNKFKQRSAAAVIAIALVASSGGVAEAKNKDNEHKKDRSSILASATSAFRMKLDVNHKGKTNILGQVGTVSNTGFTISSWGGTWNIVTASTTKFSNKGNLSSIKAGDIVRVQGTLSSTASTTVIAKHIESKNFKKLRNSNKEDKKKLKQSLRDILKGTTTTHSDALNLGTVRSLATSTNGLNIRLQNGTFINLHTSSTTRYFNRALNPISFSQILVGHVIAAYGSTTASTSTVNATIIHDLSL